MIVPFTKEVEFQRPVNALLKFQPILPPSVEEWCKENCTGNFKEALIEVRTRHLITFSSGINFELDEDAVMFKLALPLS